ncbi:MAG TPA: aminodeoxychorismate/anthranilate synthase component II [Cytophagales bacterium]|nr:aminodeoxychorismate/anthranilate synthase component II [Cytophagales bacterium]
MKILVLDNYDSFTYNLVHLITELGYGSQMDVYRNNKIDLKSIDSYDKILLSPGPGIPSEAGIMQEVIKTYGPKKSILGVCLGHQGIAEAYGGSLQNMTEVLHGIATKIKILNGDPLFKDIPKELTVARYHSWTVVADSLPQEIEITAVDDNNLVMGIKHKIHDVKGVQFHPESFLTEYGKEMMINWLEGK